MFFIFLTLFTNFSSAEITEQELIDHVLEKFPAVQMAKQDLKNAQAQETAARGAFDIVIQGNWTDNTGDYEYDFLQSRIVKPTSLFGLDLYAGFRKSDGSIPVYDGNLQTLDQGEWSVGAKLPLLRGFLIDENRANLRKSELQVQRQQLQLQVSELNQLEKALHAYWNWKLARERVRIQKGLLETALTRDTWLERRTKAGDIARFERNDNLRTVLQRRSLLMQSEQILKAAEAEALVYIDQPELILKLKQPLSTTQTQGTEWRMPFNLSDYIKSPDLLMESALQKRPDFASLAVQMSQLEVEKDLQKNSFLPKLDIETQYSRDRGMGSSSLDDDNMKVSVNFEVPLQYRKIKGRADLAEGNLQRLKHERNLLQRQWNARLVTLQNSLDISLQRRDLAQQEFSLATNLEKGERTRLRQGETNVLMVNLREQAAAEAELRLAETSTDVLKNYVSISLSVGDIPYKK